MKKALTYLLFTFGILVILLNRTARHWDTSRPELKLRAQPAKGTEVPWEPGLPGLVP